MFNSIKSANLLNNDKQVKIAYGKKSLGHEILVTLTYNKSKGTHNQTITVPHTLYKPMV